MLQLSCSSFILVTLLEKSFCFIDLIFLNQDYEISLGDEVELPVSTLAIFFSAVTSRNKCETHFPQRWLLTYFFHFTKAARIVDGHVRNSTI